ncbi:fasciclin-like arabinogalactan protein 13 [Carica papaya]|uniref:fasciclin-like arabinogalactan protein 13 n=1 Tax=Carica papaya TaxID=3649 RepID=UPI000B8CCED0|nr:fasciclin-like arabinogalactan protein 13 [Carica papaya]
MAAAAAAAAANLLTLTSFLLLISTGTLAQTSSAPAPGPAGPVNLTGILEKAGQFTTFIMLLNTTQVDSQIRNQLNSSTEGMTVFAPTDNAFRNLKAGTINNLDTQKKVQLVLYHVLPKFYSLSDLLLVSNPVRTQATGQDGGVFGLNFTGQGNQVNVSTGIVETQINNALRQQFPLAVYQVDMVLLPEELSGTKSPSASPTAKAPSSEDSNSKVPSAKEPSPEDNRDGSGSSGRSLGLGLVVGLASLCMGLLS